VPGPGAHFFEAVRSALQENPAGVGHHSSDLPIIAEDLGLITPDVIALRDGFNLPGMKIAQFAFSGPENPFLPHHYPQNCVAYTGTHDNNTARGWYESAPQAESNFALRYLGQTPDISNTLKTPAQGFAEKLIRLVWASVAVFALAPMQDLLNLGGEARMNYPSRLGGNWDWRMEEGAMSEEIKESLKGLNLLYSR